MDEPFYRSWFKPQTSIGTDRDLQLETFLVLQSRVGYKTLGIRLVCTHKGTAVLNGFTLLYSI